MRDLKGKAIERIVVRGTNWVGDAVMTVPALRELRRLFPNAHLTLATRSSAKELFAEADFIDDLLVWDRRGLSSLRAQVREWKSRNFDLAVLFQNAFAAALIPFLARVPFRIGYATERRGFLLTYPIGLPDWRSSKHEVFYYLNLVASLERLIIGNERAIEDYQPDAQLNISQSRRAGAANFLSRQGVKGDGKLIALCPGSINSRAKRWPAGSFAALADLLIDRQAQVLLIGSPEESEVSLEVARHMRNEPIMLTGNTTLSQVIEVLDLVDLLITNDTGPAHIAAALGRPTLVIFGPTNPLTTRPFSASAEIVRHAPECAPCMLRDCPIDHRCMTAISPAEVFARAQAVLGTQDEVRDPGVQPTGAVA
ncbi:MAG TPA: lipopolysaccharide heptosyltransferase II [Pyrinomonadaceae bacterium]|nr:lipopolysaccharide heptosyltransferase II [Pyrinomonadaceae bacterium]